MKFLSSSEKQTFNFAQKFSSQLAGGQILGLIGNLGAGKTIFTKGLAAGLGIKKNVSSPTFILMRLYSVNLPKIKHLIHIDAYRLTSHQDLTAIGATEYFNKPDALVVIEWANKIKKILPPRTKFVKITIDKSQRTINY